jgi:prepilin-type N-terminal cleavage/methylation domain-containing protein
MNPLKYITTGREKMNYKMKQGSTGKSEKGRKWRGFTIIEVVLVLAIAGLIFMVVFLAVPGLQRGQRDTQRKQDLGRLISTITSLQSNNRGNIPDCMVDYEADNGGTGNGMVYAELIAGGSRFDDPSSHAPYAINGIVGGGADCSGGLQVGSAVFTNTSSKNDDGTTNSASAVGSYYIGIGVSCANSLTMEQPVFQEGGSGGAASFAVAMRTEGGIYCQNG